MVNNNGDIEHMVLTRLLHMNATLAGITTGTVSGLAIFFATNFLILKGGPDVGAHLWLLGQFFWGYTVTVPGSFVGLVYGFVCGFVIGYVVARIYNWLADLREASRPHESHVDSTITSQHR